MTAWVANYLVAFSEDESSLSEFEKKVSKHRQPRWAEADSVLNEMCDRMSRGVPPREVAMEMAGGPSWIADFYQLPAAPVNERWINNFKEHCSTEIVRIRRFIPLQKRGEVLSLESIFPTPKHISIFSNELAGHPWRVQQWGTGEDAFGTDARSISRERGGIYSKVFTLFTTHSIPIGVINHAAKMNRDLQFSLIGFDFLKRNCTAYAYSKEVRIDFSHQIKRYYDEIVIEDGTSIHYDEFRVHKHALLMRAALVREASNMSVYPGKLVQLYA